MISRYSQPVTRQDEWVIERLNGKHRGYYVEVGAHDGVRHSNTKMLEDHFKWSGLLVEPQADLYRELVKNRQSAANDLSPWVIGAENDTDVFFLDGNSFGGIEQFMPDDWRREHKIRGTRGEWRTTTTLYKLLYHHACPKSIDYLSLDVEGAELPILESFCRYGVKLYGFNVITVEFRYDEMLLAKLEELLEPAYTLEKVEAFDAFFVNRSL